MYICLSACLSVYMYVYMYVCKIDKIVKMDKTSGIFYQFYSFTQRFIRSNNFINLSLLYKSYSALFCLSVLNYFTSYVCMYSS